ncbi:hypothetical protein ER308_11035 [Egibacter rhizosphaerae]|uniref:Uncharacterized protein n=1 Tax=Egibacter rhizosphaerae TaxID=1670831 RepID=A0A411YFW3_9ACTN|nr:hypothetical protein [Egibacter rhizosphaerae]QBI20041.1 hypothetical protein ER308_11035 [Egibacter rhizosphaerae]
MLLFVVGALLVVNVWAVVDARLAATAAAREAARAFATADSGEALAAANAARERTLESQGWARETLVAGASSLPRRHERCAEATATVTLRVDPILLPQVGWTDGFTATGRHTELVNPLRGGLEGPELPAPGEGGSLCS